MNRRESKEVNNLNNFEKVLEEFLNDKNNQIYFGLGENSEKYKTATTRYEAWMMVTALSNIVLIGKIDELINIMKKKDR